MRLQKVPNFVLHYLAVSMILITKEDGKQQILIDLLFIFTGT